MQATFISQQNFKENGDEQITPQTHSVRGVEILLDEGVIKFPKEETEMECIDGVWQQKKQV